MQRPQFSFEWTLTTVTTSVATTTVKPTTTVVPTTEEEVIRYVNISSYNNTRTLTHEYDIDFVRFVSGVNNGKRFDLKPINVNPYVYITNPNTKCSNPPLKNNANISILILIKSEPDNFHLRQTIRWTWESFTAYHDYVRIVFLLGISPDPEDKNTDVLVEHARYNDIVQQNFIDKYRNLTLKTVMGYKWTEQYCSEATHVLMQDDDYHFNVKNLVAYIKRYKSPDSIFAGVLRLKSPTVRRPTSKILRIQPGVRSRYLSSFSSRKQLHFEHALCETNCNDYPLCKKHPNGRYIYRHVGDETQYISKK